MLQNHRTTIELFGPIEEDFIQEVPFERRVKRGQDRTFQAKAYSNVHMYWGQ